MRSAAIALGALVLLSGVVTGNPPAVRAAPLAEIPQLKVDVPCEPPQIGDSEGLATYSVTVRGYSFDVTRIVSLYVNGSPVPSPADAISVNGSGAFETPVSFSQASDQRSAQVAAYYQDTGVTEIPIALAYFEVPCASPSATIAVQPDCADPGVPLSIHVTGSGFLPNLPIDLVVKGFYDETQYGSVNDTIPADPNALAIDVGATLPAPGPYRVVATQKYRLGDEGFDTLPSATAYIVAPCSQVTLAPTCGPTGTGPNRYRIQLSGTGFLPGVPVDIVFDTYGQPEYFRSDFAVNQDGSWGPAEIQPYGRPGPTAYDISVSQSNDSPVLHTTHISFTVPCGQATITLQPECASPQFVGDPPQTVAITVSGTGFQPNLPVIATFDPDAVSGPAFTPEMSPPVDALGDGSFTTQLTVAARPARSYTVRAQQERSGVSVDTTFNFPCKKPRPRLRPTPTCAPDASGLTVATSVQLDGRRFIPGTVQLAFDPDGAPQPLPPANAGADGSFSVAVPLSFGPGPYRIAAFQSDANQPLTLVKVDFDCAPQTSPTLEISPGSVAPGFVVTVTGTGFPAGSSVDLSWSDGIGASLPIAVTAGPDGSFVKQVLIFSHDFAGTRDMTAGTPANANAFPDATAQLTVTAGQGSPPSYTLFGGSPSDQPPLILRR